MQDLFDLNMKKYLSTYNIARIVLTLTCVIFFVLQSYQETDKYFSNMTSVSTKSVKNANVRFPTIIVCLKDPFKIKRYPKSLEEFRDITYTADEVFYNVPNSYKIKSIATIWQGMCFLLERTKGSDPVLYMTFKITQDLKMYYVDKGKELCLIYGLAFCDVQIEETLANAHGNDIAVSAKKFIRVPG